VEHEFEGRHDANGEGRIRTGDTTIFSRDAYLASRVIEMRLARLPCGFGATSGTILAGPDYLDYPWMLGVSGAFGR